MKIRLSLMMLILSINSFAQEMTCLDKLLPFNRHSGLHQVTKEEWNDNRDVLDAEGAKAALNFLINSKLLCKTGEVIFKIQPECSQTIADVPQSMSCFAFSNLGYFVLSRDNSKNYNFIFSKDKKFSELKKF